MTFNALAWYWLDAAGDVYSSAAQAIIPASDPGYAAFLAAGNTPAAWPRDATGAQTNAALYAVLQPYGIGAALAPLPTQAELIADASAKQIALRDGGITVNVGTSAAPVVVNVSTDTEGRADVASNMQMIGLAAQLGEAAPVFCWDNGDGTTISLSSTQMQTISWRLNTYRQATQTTLGAIFTAIVNGTLTTTAGIAAANWPATAS